MDNDFQINLKSLKNMNSSQWPKFLTGKYTPVLPKNATAGNGSPKKGPRADSIEEISGKKLDSNKSHGISMDNPFREQ